MEKQTPDKVKQLENELRAKENEFFLLKRHQENCMNEFKKLHDYYLDLANRNAEAIKPDFSEGSKLILENNFREYSGRASAIKECMSILSSNY